MDNGLDTGYDDTKVVIEGFRYGKSNINDIMHVCADVKDGKGSRHVMGNDRKRRTSKVALVYALVMINAAVIAYHVFLLPSIFFSPSSSSSSSSGLRGISGPVVSVFVITRLKRYISMTLYNRKQHFMHISFIDSALMIDDALMQIIHTWNDHLPYIPNAASPTQDYPISCHPQAPQTPSLFLTLGLPSHPFPKIYNQTSLLSPPPSVALPSTAQSLLNATVSVAA